MNKQVETTAKVLTPYSYLEYARFRFRSPAFGIKGTHRLSSISSPSNPKYRWLSKLHVSFPRTQLPSPST